MQERTLLLAVTGMSPAVITETLYGIDRHGDAWPKAIQVITTSKGKEHIAQGLIADRQLEKLCQELGKPMIPFSDEQILVVPGANGQAVEDARSLEDHEALANYIMTTVRDLTVDQDTRIHASIAGGRKTMTFYLGYAMSLFGRHFDQLSHVLMGENSAHFEGCTNFFFPTRDDHYVQDRDGKEYNAKEATIILADIPFIRQRSVVPDLIKKVEGNINFRQLIDLINLGDQPEQIQLHVYPTEQRLVIKNRRLARELASVEFSNAVHWSLYLLFLEDTLKDPDERDEYTSPKEPEKKAWAKRDDSAEPKPKYRDDAFGLGLLLKLCEITGQEAKGSDFDDLIAHLEEVLARQNIHPSIKRCLSSLSEKGFTASTFSTYLNSIKKTLEDGLSVNLASHIMPKQVDQTLSEEELRELKAEERKDEKRRLKKENMSRRTTKTGKKRGLHYLVQLPNPEKQIIIYP